MFSTWETNLIEQTFVWIRLHRRHTPDLHWYMRSLEEVCIRALAAVGLHGATVFPQNHSFRSLS